jgi:hypothetical protein
MKRLVPLLILIVAVSGYFWWSSAHKITSTDKIHVELYEGANGTWDPQMQIFPFERLPTTMLSLQWTPPEKTYNHFVITISTEDGQFLRSESGEHDRVSLDPDALEPGTTYIFALQACLDPRCETWLIAQDEYSGTTQEALFESKEEDKDEDV